MSVGFRFGVRAHLAGDHLNFPEDTVDDYVDENGLALILDNEADGFLVGARVMPELVFGKRLGLFADVGANYTLQGLTYPEGIFSESVCEDLGTGFYGNAGEAGNGCGYEPADPDKAIFNRGAFELQGGLKLWAIPDRFYFAGAFGARWEGFSDGAQMETDNSQGMTTLTSNGPLYLASGHLGWLPEPAENLGKSNWDLLTAVRVDYAWGTSSGDDAGGKSGMELSRNEWRVGAEVGFTWDKLIRFPAPRTHLSRPAPAAAAELSPGLAAPVEGATFSSDPIEQILFFEMATQMAGIPGVTYLGSGAYKVRSLDGVVTIYSVRPILNPEEGFSPARFQSDGANYDYVIDMKDGDGNPVGIFTTAPGSAGTFEDLKSDLK